MMEITAVTTRTRSATGSSTFPTVDTWWKRRATNPSTQSVAPRTAEQDGGRRLPVGAEQEPQEQRDAGQADQGDGVGHGQDPVEAGLRHPSVRPPVQEVTGVPAGPGESDHHHGPRRGHPRHRPPRRQAGARRRRRVGPPMPSVAPVVLRHSSNSPGLLADALTRSSLRVREVSPPHTRPDRRPTGRQAPVSRPSGGRSPSPNRSRARGRGRSAWSPGPLRVDHRPAFGRSGSGPPAARPEDAAPLAA